MNVFVELLATFLCSMIAAIAVFFVRARLLRAGPARSSLERLSGLEPQLADRIFFVMALVYLLVFGSLSLLKYYGMAVPERDLAQYDQLVWNSLHGRLMEGTIVVDAPLFLAKSFTPIMLGFVPLYALWNSPAVLLIVQTLALTLGGLPIFWFSRKRLGPWLALIVTMTYYMSPAVQSMNLDEFHEIALAVPLLSLALYFLLRFQYKPFLVTLVPAFLVKEEIAIIILMLGIYIFLFQKAKHLGIALAAFGELSAWWLLQYVIPFFRSAQPGSFYYLGRYGYLGPTLPAILHTIATRPDIVLQHVLVPGKIEYVLQLLVPLAFVPLVGVEIFVLTLPTFGYTLLSDVSWQYSIRTAYPAPLIPFLFFAAILGMQRLATWGRQANPGDTVKRVSNWGIARQWALGTLMLTAGALSYQLQGQGPFARYFQNDIYVIDSDAFTKDDWMRSIPRNKVVVAQNEFLAHVSGRQFVYEIPSIPDCRQADYMIADPGKPWYKIHFGAWAECLGSGYFSTAIESKGFAIVKPRVPEHSLVVRFDKPLTLLAYSIQPEKPMLGGMAFQPILLLQANDSTGLTTRVAMQLVDAQGHVWSRQDRAIGEVARTDQRQVGKPLVDQYRLELPETIPAGEYQMTLAVHPSQSEDSVEAMDEHGNSLGTEIVLTTVRIRKTNPP